MGHDDKGATFAHIDGEIVGISTILKGKVKTLRIYNLQEGLDALRVLAGPKSVNSLSIVTTTVSPKSYVYPIENIVEPTTQNNAAQLVMESKNYGVGDIATALQFHKADANLYESLEGDGVAFATPGGWLQDLKLDTYAVKLVPHIFALNESPGLHLHIGWNGCDLTLIENGRIRITNSFSTGGLSRVARLLGPRGKELLLNEFNEESTPSSDSEIYTFAEDVFSEYFSTIEEWRSKGLIESQKLYLHGFGTMLRQILDISRSEGIEPNLSKEDEENLSLLDKRFLLLGFTQLILSRKRISEIEFILLRSNRKDAKAIEIKTKKNNLNKFKLIKAMFAIIVSSVLLLVAVTISSNLNKEQYNPPSEDRNTVEKIISVPEEPEIANIGSTNSDAPKFDFKDLGCENQIGILKEFLVETPNTKEITDNSMLTSFIGQMFVTFNQCGLEMKNDRYESFYNDQYSPWTEYNKLDKVTLKPLSAS